VLNTLLEPATTYEKGTGPLIVVRLCGVPGATALQQCLRNLLQRFNKQDAFDVILSNADADLSEAIAPDFLDRLTNWRKASNIDEPITVFEGIVIISHCLI
jgi:hypothetical protein